MGISNMIILMKRFLVSLGSRIPYCLDMYVLFRGSSHWILPTLLLMLSLYLCVMHLALQI